jgi:hypothetical protein
MDDRNNCGFCGNPCHDAEQCIAASCVCAGPLRAVCNGRCMDTSADPMNCGGCNLPCAQNANCVQGVCQLCPMGETRCGNDCVNRQTDVNHCGQCFNPCPGEHPICSGGQCGNLG